MKNKESLLQYMEAVHLGVKGDVVDASTGQPVQNANVICSPVSDVTLFRYINFNLSSCASRPAADFYQPVRCWLSS